MQVALLKKPESLRREAVISLWRGPCDVDFGDRAIQESGLLDNCSIANSVDVADHARELHTATQENQDHRARRSMIGEHTV